ncbi:MAG: VanW family protein, partial [Chlorobia bacterium]|nr:VanW family protein [Fimbriimonadaceae bacterium]
ASRFVSTIRPNTQIGIVAVGGLTKEDAAKKLRIWWESERVSELSLTNSLIKNPLPRMTPGKLGITLDDAASVDQCEMSDFWAAAQSTVTGGQYEKKKLEVKFKSTDGNLDTLKKIVKSAIGAPRPARVNFVGGTIVREPEVTSYELDESALSGAVVAGLEGNGEIEIPIKEAPKKLPDEKLAEISEVMSEFSTKFPAYQASRNTNIRLASAKLNGQILMPGEQLSFNTCVGRRTVQGGYRLAPVLVSGRHDTGIGGGICQVSTTFYNASLLADLKIVKRSNHSIPSAYVAVGRDATVDYGSLDFVIENNQEGPIAVTSQYENGKITFRVLGKKVPGKTVKVVTSGHSAWGNGVKTVVDRSLPAGSRRVIEKGSAGHAITTFRVVFENGVEVRKDVLGRSIYRGSPRIIAVNNAPRAPKPSAPSVASTPPPSNPEPAIPPIDGN